MNGAAEAADLLRSRRARLRPEDVGLPAGGRRRTPGLRREEVALLAGISPTYYTFLEQGRDLSPSAQVLDALARALRLDPAERAHLYELVHGPAPAPASPLDAAPAELVDLVDRLDPHPTYVTGRSWEVLAANRACRLLWADWPALPARDRNVLLWTFLDPRARTVLVEWEQEAAAQLARFRAAAARDPGDPRLAAVADRLRAGSAEARAWWARHDVAPLSSGTKVVAHPALGPITFSHLVLQLADDPGLKLVTFRAADADQARIAALLETAP